MNEQVVKLMQGVVRVAVERFRQYNETGLLDPEYERTHHLNARYQEVCLTMAVASAIPEVIPDAFDAALLRKVALRAADTWLHSLTRKGAVRPLRQGKADPQATAYGIFAVSRTFTILDSELPQSLRLRGQRALRKSSGYLLRAGIPEGPETRPLRFAALLAAGMWLGDSGLIASARRIRSEAEAFLHRQLTHDFTRGDAGALSLALAYLVLGAREGKDEDLELWRLIAKRCQLSLTPTGFFGGGAESSLASLPISTGFERMAARLPDAARVAKALRVGWSSGFYNSILDTDIPWLTPLHYLILYGQDLDEENEKAIEGAEEDETGIVLENGSGKRRFGDWLLRMSAGGAVGWIHHLPSGSTRVFGSPTGMSLREGPWIIEGNRVRHPAMSGEFRVERDDPWTVEGELYSVPIPGAVRSPRKIGLPLIRGKQVRVSTRLAPPRVGGATKVSNPLRFKREIELKDGALTIETYIPGRIMHRLPVVWPGGLFGKITVDKRPVESHRPFQERRVRELNFGGDYWPTWVLRFDRPVDLLYEPIHGSIPNSPMRYLTAAAGTLDIIANDRLHLAFRVLDQPPEQEEPS